MTFISYAQNFEDVMLKRALSDISIGFYVDVGAAWPDEHSVTKAFYDMGWSGVNIEPNPYFIQRLKRERVRDINLPVAVSDCAGSLNLKLIKDTGLSTLSDDVANGHKDSGWNLEKICVDVVTLESVFANHIPAGIEVHFLKIDVEGLECQVVKGNDWSTNRPWIILIESTLPLTQNESFQSWESILVVNGYEFVYADGLNRFYVASEKSELKDKFRFPPNVFDNFVTPNDVKVDVLKSTVKNFETTVFELEAEVANQRSIEVLLNERLAFYESLVDNYEKSLSWKLTKPLRSLNPRRFFNATLRKVGKVIQKNDRLAFYLKNRLEPYPRLWSYLKSVVLFEEAGKASSLNSFHKIEFDFGCIAFSKGPLEDRRGIGRVARELLNGFLSEAREVNTSPGFCEKDLYFYASIHWCPIELASRSVVMIHDVIPLRFPQYFAGPAHEWNSKYKNIAVQARHIVTISESSADDIVNYLGVPRDRISVIYNGVSRLNCSEQISVELPNKPYFVFFGSHDHHKNVDILLKGMKELEAGSFSLVMIGDNEHCKSTVLSMGLRDQVVFLGRVNDEEAAHVIGNAVALLFPSLYEGFGLPPLEAALLGTPSICSKRPAMTELLEGAAIFVDPVEASQWSASMLKLAEDDRYRAELGERARSIAESYTWERSSSSFISLFKDLMS